MFMLQNENLSVEFDSEGRLTGLRNRKTNREYAGGGSLWRIIFSHGIVKEEVLEGEAFPMRVESSGASGLTLTAQVHSFFVTLRVRLEAEGVAFDAELENHSGDGEILRECQFPLIKNVRLSPATEYIDSFFGGRRVADIPAHMAKCATAYMSPDQEALESSILYPGFASLNFFVLAESENTLYLGSHDPEFN